MAVLFILASSPNLGNKQVETEKPQSSDDFKMQPPHPDPAVWHLKSYGTEA
jgi:hypothetical protein